MEEKNLQYHEQIETEMLVFDIEQHCKWLLQQRNDRECRIEDPDGKLRAMLKEVLEKTEIDNWKGN